MLPKKNSRSKEGLPEASGRPPRTPGGPPEATERPFRFRLVGIFKIFGIFADAMVCPGLSKVPLNFLCVL